MKFIAAIMLSLLVAGCGGSEEPPAETKRPGIGANGRRDLVGTGAPIAGVKDGKSYAAFDALRDREGTRLAFAGYGCMSDCADLINGYRAAKAASIKDARRCVGQTWEELEGCVAFANGESATLSNLPPLGS